MAKAVAAKGGKGKKKKWSKGKVKEKANNLVLFDKATYDKLMKEAPKYQLITPSILSDRMKITGSLARKVIKDLAAKGEIKEISSHKMQRIFTTAAKPQEEKPAETAKEETKPKKEKKKKPKNAGDAVLAQKYTPASQLRWPPIFRT